MKTEKEDREKQRLLDIKSILLDEKTKLILLALLLCGIAIAFIPQYLSDDTKSTAESETELSSYTRELEENLARIVSGVKGAGKTQVFVTLESGFENIYASDASVYETSSAGGADVKSEKQLVLTGTGTNGEQPVVVKQLSPKIKGVVIVCDGGADRSVKEKVTELAATAFNISTTKIYVTGGNLS